METPTSPKTKVCQCSILTHGCPSCRSDFGELQASQRQENLTDDNPSDAKIWNAWRRSSLASSSSEQWNVHSSRRSLPRLKLDTASAIASRRHSGEAEVDVEAVPRKQVSRPPQHLPRVRFSPETKIDTSSNRQDSAASEQGPAPFAQSESVKRGSVTLAPWQRPLRDWEVVNVGEGVFFQDWQYVDRAAECSRARGRLLNSVELRSLIERARHVPRRPRKVKFGGSSENDESKPRRLTSTPEQVEQLKQLWAERGRSRLWREEAEMEDEGGRQEEGSDAGISAKMRGTWSKWLPSLPSTKVKRKEVREYFQRKTAEESLRSLHENTISRASQDKQRPARKRAGLEDESAVGGEDSDRSDGGASSSSSHVGFTRRIRETLRSPRHSPTRLEWDSSSSDSSSEVSHIEVQQNWHRV